MTPVIQALPRIAGTIAVAPADRRLARRSGRRTSSRSPTRGSSRRRRASARARGARRSAPTGRCRSPSGRAGPARRRPRSSRPRRRPATARRSGRCSRPAISGFSGWTHGSCSRAASADQLADARQVARLATARARSRARRASAIAYHMPPYATSTVSVPSPRPRAARRAGRRSTARSSSSTHSTFPSRHAARDLDDARRRLEPERRLRLAHLDHARLEQHRRDADRVRARHRRILGRLHDDVADGAVRARRRHDQVRVHRDAPARLAEEQPPERVVRAQRLHLLEDRRARRRQHAADDDVPDLAAGVAPDDGDGTARSACLRRDDRSRDRPLEVADPQKPVAAEDEEAREEGEVQPEAMPPQSTVSE